MRKVSNSMDQLSKVGAMLQMSNENSLTPAEDAKKTRSFGQSNIDSYLDQNENRVLQESNEPSSEQVLSLNKNQIDQMTLFDVCTAQ